jgi:hypothetical protein
LEHLDDQERKRKKNVGQKGKLKETKEKVTRTENKGRRKDQYQGKKTNWLQKATVQSPWTKNDMATARNTGTTGCIFQYLLGLHQLSFLGGLSLYMVWCAFSAQLRPSKLSSLCLF